MRILVGNLFVWAGVIMFLVQASHAVIELLRPTAVGSANTKGLEALVKALTEKFPVAALGVASVWLGGQILEWF